MKKIRWNWWDKEKKRWRWPEHYTEKDPPMVERLRTAILNISETQLKNSEIVWSEGELDE